MELYRERQKIVIQSNVQEKNSSPIFKKILASPQFNIFKAVLIYLLIYHCFYMPPIILYLLYFNVLLFYYFYFLFFYCDVYVCMCVRPKLS